MNAPDDIQPEVSVLPSPVAPTDEEVIDARALHLAWEPVEGATAYRVEVAQDTSFEELLFESTVGRQTEWEAPKPLPMDGQTYYWRVLARDADGWSQGERVQSFISATPEELKQAPGAARPDEDLGPYPALVRSAGADVAAELTGDEERLREEREMGVAHEGVETGQILGLVTVTGVVLLILVPALLFVWVSRASQDAQLEAVVRTEYPALQEAEAGAARRLQQYGVVDAEEDVYRIPIERAMQLMLNEQPSADGAAVVELPLQPAE